MLYYKVFFLLFTLAEVVFTLVYYLIRRSFDNVLLTGGILYIGGMIVGYVAYRVAAYRRRRKKLLDQLP